MSSREEFEAFRDKRNAQLAEEGVKENSRYWITNAHYPTWQASRAALAVELPKYTDYLPKDMDAAQHVLHDAKRSIEAAGIPVKQQ